MNVMSPQIITLHNFDINWKVHSFHVLLFIKMTTPVAVRKFALVLFVNIMLKLQQCTVSTRTLTPYFSDYPHKTIPEKRIDYRDDFTSHIYR